MCPTAQGVNVNVTLTPETLGLPAKTPRKKSKCLWVFKWALAWIVTCLAIGSSVAVYFLMKAITHSHKIVALR